MEYEPREGVDYIVDLYAVAGVSADAETDELKRALIDRIKEYHPDRLEGMAPEFRTKGERMSSLLNRARHILLDIDRRAEFDSILTDWDGPVSTDGTPAITTDRYIQMAMADWPAEEVEAALAGRVREIEALTGYSPRRLAFVEKMAAAGGAEADDALRAEYEDALLERDRVLAIEEVNRSKLLGLPDISQERYVAALGYADGIGDRLETARSARLEQLRVQALGGVSARLALLAGEESPTAVPQDGVASVMPSLELPAYFEDQAARVQAIAREREAITQKRLNNFKPDYPEAQLQTGFRQDLAIGVDGKLWLGAKVDRQGRHVDMADLPDDIVRLLEQGDTRAAIESGFNVMTLGLLDHIDIRDLLAVAIEQYIAKYED